MKYIKPSLAVVNYNLLDDCSDSFSMGGEILTGSVKDKSSQYSAVKSEECFDEYNDLNRPNSIWDDNWESN